MIDDFCYDILTVVHTDSTIYPSWAPILSQLTALFLQLQHVPVDSLWLLLASGSFLEANQTSRCKAHWPWDFHEVRFLGPKFGGRRRIGRKRRRPLEMALGAVCSILFWDECLLLPAFHSGSLLYVCNQHSTVSKIHFYLTLTTILWSRPEYHSYFIDGNIFVWGHAVSILQRQDSNPLFQNPGFLSIGFRTLYNLMFG